MEIRKLVKKVNKLKSKTKLIKTKVENEQNYLLKIKRKMFYPQIMTIPGTI